MHSSDSALWCTPLIVPSGALLWCITGPHPSLRSAQSVRSLPRWFPYHSAPSNAAWALWFRTTVLRPAELFSPGLLLIFGHPHHLPSWSRLTVSIFTSSVFFPSDVHPLCMHWFLWLYILLGQAACFFPRKTSILQWDSFGYSLPTICLSWCYLHTLFPYALLQIGDNIDLTYNS